MTKTIRVLGMRSNSDEGALILDFPNNLEGMQKFVDGYIEAIRITENIVLWVNEEGLLKELPFNFYLTNTDGEPISPIVGDAFFAGINAEGDNVSLTDDDLKILEERFISRRFFKQYK